MTVQIGRAVRTLTVAGGNLFEVAAKEYADHTLWSLIAKANGLRDPFLTGTITLVIPDKPAQSRANSGVVGA